MKETHKRNWAVASKKLICLLIISAVEWYQLDISCTLTRQLHTIEAECIFLNICIIMILNLVVFLLVNRLWLTVMISEVLWAGVAVTNFYVIQYHGMPFTITELKNFRTALHVLKSYDLTIGKTPIKILVVCGLVIVYCLWQRKKEEIRKRSIKGIALPCVGILICVIYILIGFYSPTPIKPGKTIGWSWEEAYGKYGYVTCFLEDLYYKNSAVNKPEHYSLEHVEEIYTHYKNRDAEQEIQDYPDIIFIVNETFYDLHHVADFETDVDYLKNIRNMDNVIRGYAVSPSIYGGTNSSEYELLTSNSLYIMNSGVTPFNAIDLTDAVSIVSYLKSLGYSTLGTHTEPGINYNRIRGYKDLGFDTVKFEEQYENMEYYHKRWYETDTSVYRNLERWYEEMGDSPRFLYLLTIQNHGNWDFNEAEYDTVHVTQSEFEMFDMINEYLTCISLSDEAFFELTSYLKTVDRRVIVCMVGDHCPSFAGEIASTDLSLEEKALRLRETPFYIWSNYSIEKCDKLGSVGMIYVAPLLLWLADVPLSGYYQYLIDLKEQVPIITSYGKYFNSDRDCFSVGDGTYGKLVNVYFQIEYSNIVKAVEDTTFFE